MTRTSSHPFRIAIIGSGVSGIAAANILQQCGHTVTIYEKSSQIGDVWAASYPQVHLQNLGTQYRLAGIPWFAEADSHPTAEQIMRYLQEAVTQKNSTSLSTMKWLRWQRRPINAGH